MKRYYIHYEGSPEAVISRLKRTRKRHDMHENNVRMRGKDDLFVDSFAKVIEASLTDGEVVVLRNRGYQVEYYNHEEKPKPLYDVPGTDPKWGLPQHNQWARLEHNNGPYPAAAPNRVEYYNTMSDRTGFTGLYNWSNSYDSATISGGRIIQSGLQYIGVPNMWDRGFTGQGIKICVIDQGYSGLYNHQDITITASYDIWGPGNAELDTFQHSTQMIGLIAARNGGGSGLVGAAYNAQIYAASWNDVGAALSWGYQQGCRLFNCSFATAQNSYATAMIKKIIAGGGMVLVAAGNNVSTLGTINPFALVKGTTVVGGLNGGGVLTIPDTWRYKSIIPVDGKGVDFALPAFALNTHFNTPIVAPQATNEYAYAAGTSHACAQMTGLLALLMEAYPSTAGEVLVAMLKRKSRRFTDLGYESRIPNTEWVKARK